jgi:tetratricopeptide (TPR) repeat protein
MNRDTLSTRLEEAKRCRLEGQHELALSLLDDILAEIPANTVDADLKEIRLDSFWECGTLLKDLGRHEEALETNTQYYFEAGNSSHAIKALIKIGVQQGFFGDYKAALQTFLEAKVLAEALNDTAGRSKVYHGLGSYLLRLGRFEESLFESQKALTLYEQLGNKDGVSGVLGNIGLGYTCLGVMDKAIDTYQTGLQGDVSPFEKVYLLLHLGETYAALYARQEALNCFREALLLVDANSVRMKADILRNIGLQLFYFGQREEASELLAESLVLAEQSQEQDILLQILASVANVEVELENWEIAQQHAEQLLAQAEHLGVNEHQAQGLFVLGQIAAGQQDVVKAQECWQRGLFLAHETGNRNLLWRVHVGLAEVSPSPALAEAHYQIAGNIVKQILYPIEDVSLRASFLKAELVQRVLRNAGIHNLTP